MGDMSAPNGELTPVEAAILSMDEGLQKGLELAKEIMNMTKMMETSFKLMSYDLSQLSKHIQEEKKNGNIT